MVFENGSAIRVDCYAGYRGEETPRRFFLGDRAIEVVRILDQWLAPDHRYFKVESPEGHIYILRHDSATDRWALTLYERRS
ncbi:MAG TPA: hypothetical protein EYH07_02485 [Kiloniellaceae bacterium]|nr:hypothetical protein [Kiloniellaceae bacterium]